MPPPDLVDAEIPLEEDVTEDDDAVESCRVAAAARREPQGG